MEKLSPFINIREKYGEKKRLKSLSFSKKAGEKHNFFQAKHTAFNERKLQEKHIEGGIYRHLVRAFSQDDRRSLQNTSHQRFGRGGNGHLSACFSRLRRRDRLDFGKRGNHHLAQRRQEKGERRAGRKGGSLRFVYDDIFPSCRAFFKSFFLAHR